MDVSAIVVGGLGDGGWGTDDLKKRHSHVPENKHDRNELTFI